MPQPKTTRPEAEPAVPARAPLDLVVLTRDRLQSILDDAVERGRMTRSDAADLATSLLRAAGAAGGALLGSRAGSPIRGYDDLTAAQVIGRLGELTQTELRAVREYERRNANRKTVLAAAEHKLT